MRLAVRDGVIEKADPPGIYAFVDIPFKNWRPGLAHS